MTDVQLLLKKAQAAFNLYIRLRDKNNSCICGCGGRVEHAGHYYPTTYSGVRFDEINVNGQSIQCNCFKNTTAIDPEYEVGLVAKYGINVVMDLRERAIQTRLHKWNRSELREVIKTYQEKAKSLNKIPC